MELIKNYIDTSPRIEIQGYNIPFSVIEFLAVEVSMAFFYLKNISMKSIKVS